MKLKSDRTKNIFSTTKRRRRRRKKLREEKGKLRWISLRHISKPDNLTLFSLSLSHTHTLASNVPARKSGKKKYIE